MLPTMLRLRSASVEDPYAPHLEQVVIDSRDDDHEVCAYGQPVEADHGAAIYQAVEAGPLAGEAEFDSPHQPRLSAPDTRDWEGAAPLRTSSLRRQSRWLYAVSRQVMFGTSRQIVASACVVAAVGLLVAGTAGMISLRRAPTDGLSGQPPVAEVVAPRRQKISLSVNIPAAAAPPEVVEAAGASPGTGSTAPGAPPGDAVASAENPLPAEGARIGESPDQMPMPPIGPPGGVVHGQETTQLVAFDSAPFPYTGLQPSGRPFLDMEQGGRKGHHTWYGTTLWQEQTFNDNHVLVHVPAAFDPTRSGVIVVFFHGYGATLTRDILARQQVPAQISASGANAVLLSPQFAVDARDSSAGRFWEPGGFTRFLDEAAKNLARLRGDPGLEGRFAKMPVVIVAYSGGFLPAAWALKDAGVRNRVRGVLLLDAVYGEIDEFTDWTANNRGGFFVSAFTRYTQYQNALLQRRLAGMGIASQTKLDGKLGRGAAIFLPTGPDVNHNDFVTQAWTANPIRDVLSRLPDISLSDPQTVASIDH